MADLVMSVRSAKAHRRGGKLIVDIEGESANSRDKVVADGSANGDSAEVYVRVKPAEGFGTQMTGPYHCQASIDGGEAVTQVRVHARDGVKTVKVD